MPQRQEALNVLLAQLLESRGLVAAPEQIHVEKENSDFVASRTTCSSSDQIAPLERLEKLALAYYGERLIVDTFTRRHSERFRLESSFARLPVVSGCCEDSLARQRSSLLDSSDAVDQQRCS